MSIFQMLGNTFKRLRPAAPIKTVKEESHLKLSDAQVESLKRQTERAAATNTRDQQPG